MSTLFGERLVEVDETVVVTGRRLGRRRRLGRMTLIRCC